MKLFLTLVLAAVVALAASPVFATPPTFCEEIIQGVWDRCADAPYPQSEHRPPAPGTYSAGLLSCNATVTRCTYPYSASTGVYQPQPPRKETIDNTFNPADIFGQIIDYFEFLVGTGDKVLFKMSNYDDRAISDASNPKAPPPTIKATAAAGSVYSKVFTLPATNPTSNGADPAQFPFQLQGATVDELLEQVAQLPATKGGADPRIIPKVFSYLAPTINTYDGIKTSYQIVFDANNVPVMRVTKSYKECAGCSSYSYSMDFILPGLECPPGYRRLTETTTDCTLDDLETAVGSNTLKDGNCVITRGNVNPFDPDCVEFMNKGLVRTGTTADGKPVATAKNPTTGVTVSARPEPEGPDQIVSVSKPQPNNDGTVRHDVPSDPYGGQGPGQTTHYPNTPPPAYPGDTGSNTPPTGSGGTGVGVGNSCGGDDQPACKFEGMSDLVSGIEGIRNGQCGGPSQPPCGIEGMGNLIGAVGGLGTKFCGAPGQPPCSLDGEGIADGIRQGLKTEEETSLGEGLEEGEEAAEAPHEGDNLLSSILAFQGFALDPYMGSCATAFATDATPVSLETADGGKFLDATFDLVELCPLVVPHEETIRQLTIILWYVAAILIFIRMTI